MNNYYRITGYHPTEDFCFIMDCFGLYEKMWQFSSLLIQKGLKVLEVSNQDTFIDINIKPIEKDTEHIALRAIMPGKPENIIQEYEGKKYNAVKVAEYIYIPNNTKTI